MQIRRLAAWALSSAASNVGVKAPYTPTVTNAYTNCTRAHWDTNPVRSPVRETVRCPTGRNGPNARILAARVSSCSSFYSFSASLRHSLAPDIEKIVRQLYVSNYRYLPTSPKGINSNYSTEIVSNLPLITATTH